MSKKLDVNRLRQLIMRLGNGLSPRQISLDMQLDRKTIAKYSKIIDKNELLAEQLLALNDEDLYKTIYAKKRATTSQRTNVRLQFLLSQVDHFKTELARPGVTLQLLWQEYSGKERIPYGYASFCKLLKIGFHQQKVAYHKR